MSQQNVLIHAKKRHAFACVQANRIDEALGLYQQICEVDSEDAESWFMMGTLYGHLGRFADAEAALRKAINLRPGLVQAYLNLGHALELQAKLAEAEDTYRSAVALKADSADGHDALGRLCHRRGNLLDAVAHHQRAIQLNPSRVSAYLSLARALRELGNLDEAAAVSEQAVKFGTDHAEVYYGLSEVRIDQGRYDDALRAIRQALQLKPDYIEAKAAEAFILEQLRDYQGALDCLTPVLDRYQDYPELALIYARLCHFTRDYDGAIARLEDLLSKDDLTEERRSQIHFRLGDIYDQSGKFDQAFTQFQAGNRFRPGHFDAREWEGHVTTLIKTFHREAVLRAPRAGNCSERPIFIVGMPLSGAALVEQILSAYPEVATSDALPDMGRLAVEFKAALNCTVPINDIAQLSREQCDTLAQPYLEMLERCFSENLRVIDMQLQNYLHLGIIALLFPMARVIQCVRDPLDTSLSAYFQEFTRKPPYAYDLADLGGYYRQYQRLMSHWDQVLDIPIFEVRYEDLVRNPNKLGRIMVEFCGLKWDKKCLDFCKGEHLAATSGFQQLRQPSRTCSVGRWIHYTSHLEPLKQALAGHGPS